MDAFALVFCYLQCLQKNMNLLAITEAIARKAQMFSVSIIEILFRNVLFIYLS